MKIQSINSTNFKGLFTDKTSQNGGNWLMEYSPYSWESDNKSKMTPKKKVDLSASYLPDNEEIFEKIPNHYEYSSDILGTTSYYVDHYTNKMRKTITEVPAMDRKTSLQVLDKKMGVFLNMKNEAMDHIDKLMLDNAEFYNIAKNKYESYSGYYEESFWKSSKNEDKRLMDTAFSSLKDRVSVILENINKYTGIAKTLKTVQDKRNSIQKEITLLENAQNAGKLIDISRQDVKFPLQPLMDSLNNFQLFKNNSELLIALPDRTVSAKSIISALSKKGSNFVIPSEVIKYVEKLIKK